MDAPAALRPAPRRVPRVPARLLRLAADERLVELVRAGSEPAFEAVYDRHHRAILAFCRHMLGSAEEAEDAVQHTFLAAYRALQAEDGRAVNLRPWLFTIARNRCLSILRARRERPLDDVPEPSTEHLADEVQRREDLRTMLRDLHELPEDQRAALVLAEVGDVSHEEIAEVLGVRREKVKALVFQARSSLAASRVAREVSCADVREQLAELRGGALRRTSLRRHLRDCAGCREFRTAMVAQRRALAVLLPVAPTMGLKASVLGSALGGGAAAAGGAATGTGAGSGSAAAGASGGGAGLTGAASSVGGASLAAKALVVVAVAGSGAAVGTRELTDRQAPAPAPARHAAPGSGSATAASATHHAHRGGAAGARGATIRTSGDAPAMGRRSTKAPTHDLGASTLAHHHGHRARGHQPAGADGNHGLGDGSGGGRTQAPGQLAKGNGGGGANRGGGATTAPGRTKAPGTNAASGNGAAHRTTPAASNGTATHGNSTGTTGAAVRSATGKALGVAKKVPAAVTTPAAPATPTNAAPASPPAGAKAHGGPNAG